MSIGLARFLLYLVPKRKGPMENNAMQIRTGLLVAVAFAVSAFAGTAQAITLDTSFGPTNASGFLSSSITDIGPNMVEIELDASALTQPGEYVDLWYFNYDGNPLTELMVTSLPDNPATVLAPSISAMPTQVFQAGTDGFFNIFLNFTDDLVPGRFDAGESYTLQVMGMGGATISASDFDLLSLPGGTDGPFYQAARIRGTGSDNEGTAWQGAGAGGSDGPSNQVPEPTAALLFGAGAVTFSIAKRRRS